MVYARYTLLEYTNMVFDRMLFVYVFCLFLFRSLVCLLERRDRHGTKVCVFFFFFTFSNVVEATSLQFSIAIFHGLCCDRFCVWLTIHFDLMISTHKHTENGWSKWLVARIHARAFIQTECVRHLTTVRPSMVRLSASASIFRRILNQRKINCNPTTKYWRERA